MNPLLGMPGGKSNPLEALAGDGKAILMQAIGALLRGENPKDFIRSLGNRYPAFRSVDPDNVDDALERVCNEKGLDKAEVIRQVRGFIAELGNKRITPAGWL